MGTDKALLAWDGIPLIARLADAVRDSAGAVTIVGDPGKYSGFGAPVIRDLFAGAGPLGGIHAALSHATASRNLIVACDMPWLDAGFLRELRRLSEQSPEAGVVLPVSGGRDQPLCAIYHRRLLPTLEDALRRGNLKIMQALPAASVIRIEFADESPFRNVNTPGDWHAVNYRQPA